MNTATNYLRPQTVVQRAEARQEELGILYLEGDLLALREQLDEEQLQVAVLVRTNWNRLLEDLSWHDHYEGMLTDLFVGMNIVDREDDDGEVSVSCITVKAGVCFCDGEVLSFPALGNS